jgi:hypothetical protein
MTNYMQKLAQGMCDDILKAIHKYDDSVPLALALGVLEIVKAQLIEDAKDDDES